MNTDYRKSLLATAVAALVVAPAWTLAEQVQPSQPEDGLYQQPMDQPGAGVNGGAPEQQTSPPPSAAQGTPEMGPLYGKTPEELGKMDIIGVNGEDLGEIKQVVRGRMDNDIYAVISSGGILGYGGHEVAVPLTELQLNGDKLQIGATEEDLKAKPEYVADQYVELQPQDRPISEFSAFEGAKPESGGDPTPSQP